MSELKNSVDDENLKISIDNFMFKKFQNKEPINVIDDKLQKFECIAKNCTYIVDELCVSCDVCGSNFGTCIATGQNILNKQYKKCKICRNKIKNEEIQKYKNCPLCHSKLNNLI